MMTFLRQIWIVQSALNGLFLGSLLLSTSCFADEKRDALRVQLSQAPADSIARLEILVDLVQSCWRACPNEAEQWGADAEGLFTLYPAPALEARMRVYLARVYLDRGEATDATRVIERGIAMAQEAADDRLLSLNLFNQALLYQITDRNILALDSYSALLAVYRRTENFSGLGNTLNNMGNIHRKMGEPGRALASFLEALPLVEEYSNPFNHANTLMNIGATYQLLNDPEQAEKMLRQGLANFDAEQAPLNVVEGHMRLAAVYQQQARYTESIQALSKAESIALAHNFTAKLIGIYLQGAEVALLQRDIAGSEAQTEKAHALIDDDVPEYFETRYAQQLAALAAEQGNWQRTVDLLLPVVKNIDFTQRFYEADEPYNLLRQGLYALGSYREAAELTSDYLVRYRQYMQEFRAGQTAQYAALFRDKEKAQQIAKLEQTTAQQQAVLLREQAKQRQTLLISLAVALLLIVLILLGYVRHRHLQARATLAEALMEQKRRLFADITHEMRGPLTLFKLKTEELEYDVADDPAAAFGVIHDRIHRLNAMIDDMATLSDNDTGELTVTRQMVALLPFFQRCATELKEMARQKGLETQVQIDVDDFVQGHFDPIRIAQVMTNLFSNCCKYTDAPGKILMQVHLHDDHLWVDVEDSAPGLSVEACERIFERAFRAQQAHDSKAGGSGLGLHICQRLLQAHAGRIRARPSKLGGLHITCDWPLDATEKKDE